MKTYIGIDPGKSGGIAIIVERPHNGDLKNITLHHWKMPDTERDLWDTIRSIQDGYLIDWSNHGAFAYIEQVHAMPKQGVSSCFVFGQNYGMLRGMLIAAGIPFESVTPQKWQKSLGCLSKGDKNVTKRKAQELFPTEKITHSVADALLIAEFCRRTRSQ